MELQQIERLQTETHGKPLICESPAFSLCEGHVDLATFNRALEAEGMKNAHFLEEDLSHEYWSYDGVSWAPSHKGCPDAKPVTVADWP